MAKAKKILSVRFLVINVDPTVAPREIEVRAKSADFYESLWLSAGHKVTRM